MSLEEDYSDIRDQVAKLCESFPGEYWRNLEKQPPSASYPTEFIEALTDGGYLAALIPEEYGGAGLPVRGGAVILETINRMGCSAAAGHAQMYTMGTILRHGSKEQKAKFLPKIASGELRLQAFGVTEPTTGSDTTQLKTRAERQGNGYLLNGQKVWTSRAAHSDLMLLLARTTPADQVKKRTHGISTFLIDLREAQNNGCTITPIDAMINHNTTEIFFNNVPIPGDALIGEEGKGWTYAKGLLEYERTGLAGLSKSLFELEKLKDQARTVTRGNGNLMDDSGYKAKIAELEIDLMATEYTELRSLASAAAGGELGPESSILKLKGTEIKQRIQKLTVEASGIYSPAWGDKNIGLPFAKGGTAGYLNSRYFTIYGGASEVQKDVVAKKVLGLTKGSSK